MRGVENLLGIPYKKTSGPLSVAELSTNQLPKSANCQRVRQLFAYQVQQVALHPEQALSMEGYLHTGELVVDNEEETDRFFSQVEPGDTVYAPRIRKTGDVFKSSHKDTWMKKLHVAVVLPQERIFHGSIISGEATVWDYDEFRRFYYPVRARRIT